MDSHQLSPADCKAQCESWLPLSRNHNKTWVSLALAWRVTADEKGLDNPEGAVCVQVLGQHLGVISVKALVSDRVVSVLEEMTSRLNKLPVMGGTSLCLLRVPLQVAFHSSHRPRAQSQVGDCHPSCQCLQGHCFASSSCGQEGLAWVPRTAALGLPRARL